LGGAANVYHNIVQLGGRVNLCGIVGTDEAGAVLLRQIKERGGSVEGICQLSDRPTTKKTRIIAHSQQVVRFDQEKSESLKPEVVERLLKFIKKEMVGLDCLVLSDYAKGVISPLLIEGLQELFTRHRIKVIVDPKVSHMPLYRGATLITPNHLEASQATGIEINDMASLINAGQALLNMLACEAVLITKGEQGMSLFERGGGVTHIPTVAKDVYDVTGAGDTVVSVLALALAAGAPLADAAMLSNYAAGIVVGIVGTATVQPQQIEQLLQMQGDGNP
jgi:D-beta-D-heptose 7-phosphate kinase/D-beta-D-heptose 1-phosphate adenosyltransferase